MTSWTNTIPVDEIAGRSRQDRPARALALLVAAVGVAIGWSVARFFRAIGWLAGRTWLLCAFFTESVIYGFREGAGLAQPVPEAQGPPASSRGSKL